MAKITAKLVKELRDITGAGMMDCKKALQETNGDMSAAVDYLRETGSAQAAKKAERVAAEGSTYIATEGNNAVILEVNCETDFVTRNETFQNLLVELGDHILANKPENLDEMLEQTMAAKEETVQKYIESIIGTIGEKIELRRFELLTKGDNDVFGTYTHQGGLIGALTVLEGSQDEAVAKDIAMHIAAVNPTYVSKEDVDEDEVNHEKEVLKSQALNEGKPEKIVDKMVEGRLGKFFEQICLLEQDFVKDPDMKVKKYIDNAGATVNTFIRYEVGEGKEKREENFADEVMNQIKE